MTLTLKDTGAAAARIASATINTRFEQSRTLSAMANTDLYLKFENLQFTASFKDRGALNKLLILQQQGEVKGVIAMSAGNHANKHTQRKSRRHEKLCSARHSEWRHARRGGKSCATDCGKRKSDIRPSLQ